MLVSGKRFSLGQCPVGLPLATFVFNPEKVGLGVFVNKPLQLITFQIDFILP
ncbi:hypothetical protein [Pseudomonas sp. SWI36]|uniref:hypothetical protein n=1 Tax=Pseudomonas sp. SWI36 TaxID=2083052 RepID=UPI0015AD146A|nr:hypothetical protein [Pseudomonas sp. SWI36]